MVADEDTDAVKDVLTLFDDELLALPVLLDEDVPDVDVDGDEDRDTASDTLNDVDWEGVSEAEKLSVFENEGNAVNVDEMVVDGD